MRRSRIKAASGSPARWQTCSIARAAKCAVETLESRVLLSVNVTSYHYNASETGANTNETILTPANVNINTFGKVASLPVDGQIYAQPLVVSGVSLPGGGTEDLVFVATEGDSVYAFNAEGTSTTPVWKTNLLQTGETTIPYTDVATNDIVPQIGITSTPAINTSTNTIYVEGNFKESNGTYQQRLYALDIATGAAKLGGPVVITGSVNGTGVGSVGGKISFSAMLENQRPAITLANGQVYLAFASHGDQGNYHGWVVAYNQTTLVQDYVWCNTPNGSQGGIWMSGGGLAVDSSGDLYLTSGNGTFDANTGGSDYGMALTKLSPTLQVLDYFSPYNEASLSTQDLDYGCGNAILLPTQTGSAPNEALTLGKWGGVYLNNTNTGSMGEINNPPNGPNKDLGETSTGNHQHNTFAYWNGFTYIGPDGGTLKAYAVGNGTLTTTPSSQSAHVFGTAAAQDGQGAGVSVSSNGTSNGIVWALENTGFNSNPAVLYAYNANNLTQLLWTSNQAAGGRDTSGNAVKFTTPVVANGYVYVGGAGSLTLFSNIPFAPPPPPPPPPLPPPPGGLKGFANFTPNGANGAGIDGSSTGDSNPAGVPGITADSNTLTLTTASANEASSAFYNTPLSYYNFTASFTYTASGMADGITFTLQNDSRGVHALGGGGGDFGYSSDGSHPASAISPSFAAEFNIYNGSNVGDATNGSAMTNSNSTSPVALASGDKINVSLNYSTSAQTLTETLTDTTANATFTTTYNNLNLSSILASGTAYVGFTGGTGGSTALQTVSNFYYTAGPAWLTTTSAAAWNPSTKTLTVTGPATIDLDPGTDEPNIVASGSAAKITVAPTTSPTDVHIGGVTLSNGASLTMTNVGSTRSHSNHNVLVIGTAGASADPTVSVDSSSKIDLADNDLIVHTGTSDSTGQSELATLRALAATGRGVAPGSVLNGTWTGNGLTSSSAASVDASAGYERNVLAVVLNSDQILGSDSKWTVGSSSESVGAHDILVKYTYNGDAALEGFVGDNSVTIVNGFYDAGKTTQADWAFGDFTGNGKVDDNDITILNGLYGNGDAASGLPQL